MEAPKIDYESLTRMFNDAPCNQHLKPRYLASEEKGEAWLTVRPDMLHAGGVVHGSILFKLLDDVATIAVIGSMGTSLTSTFNIYFTRPISEGEIYAVGRVVKLGRRQIIAEGEAFDQDGRLLVKGSGTFMRQ